MNEDRTTLDERYARAIVSKHLRLTETRCDVDFLIAAGWLQDGLGATLYRLRGEYDAVRADMLNAESKLPSWEKRAAEAERAVKAWPMPLIARPGFFEEPGRIRKEALDYLLTTRALALMNLKSLPAARNAFGGFAVLLAARMVFERPGGEAQVLAGQVLEVWLDPLCHHCEGRGFTGGTHRGEQRTLCRPCRGSGQRRGWIGKDAEQRLFAQKLMAEIDRQQAHVDNTMRRFLREHPETAA